MTFNNDGYSLDGQGITILTDNSAEPAFIQQNEGNIVISAPLTLQSPLIARFWIKTEQSMRPELTSQSFWIRAASAMKPVSNSRRR